MYKHGKRLLCLLSLAPAGHFLDLGLPVLFFPILTQRDSCQECVKTKAAGSALTSSSQFASEAAWLQFAPFAGLLNKQKTASLPPNGDAFLAFSMCLYLCSPRRACVVHDALS